MVRKIGGARKKAKVSGTKKHHHRKTGRRRGRRVSGINDIGGMVEKAGGLIAGAVIAREANTLIQKFVTLTPMISGLMQVVGGIMVPKLVKGPWGQNIGDGMIANGGMVMAVSTGIITGTSSNRAAYTINGTANLPVINGTANLPVVNGTRIQNSAIGTSRIQNNVVLPTQFVRKNSHFV